MQHRWIVGYLLWVFSISTGDTTAKAADSQQSDRNQGLTVQDLARGLRSAAQNIEKEIPKIGPAIGKAAKSVTGNSSEKTPSRNPPSDKK